MKMSKGQTLRVLVNARLTAAAEEIFALFERTIADYEEELCRSKEENQRKQEQLDSVLSPSVVLLKEGVHIPPTSPDPGLNQETPQTLRIKEEPEEQSLKQEEQHLPLQLPVASPESSTFCVKTEESSQLQQRQTEHREETQGEDISAEPHLHSETEGDMEHSSDTDNNEDWRTPFHVSAAQMEKESDGDHYSQVQMRARRTAAQNSGLSPKDMSAPETSAAVNKGDMSGKADGAEGKKHQCATCQKKFGKVDATGISWMDDGRLAVYVPAYGERLAVRPFCLERREGPSTSSPKRHSLLERLKQKMSIDGNRGGSRDKNEMEAGHGLICKRPHAINNTWAKKKTRKIELGWIHEGKQVRKRRGGGTRTITVPRETRKAELLNYARDLFFPHGKNQMGKFKSGSSDIVDFRVEPILDNDVTVGDLYDILKRGMLRFYLSTKDQCGEEEEESPDKEQMYDLEHYSTNSQVQFEGPPDKDQKYINISEDANEDSEEVFLDILEVKIGPQGVLQVDDTVKAQSEMEDMKTTSQHSELLQ